MTAYAAQSIEGVDVTGIYNIYNQANAQSSTNSPDYPALPFKLGTQVVCTDGSVWMFVKVATSATLAYGNTVGIDVTLFTATPALGGATYEATKKRVGFYQNTTSSDVVTFPTTSGACWIFQAKNGVWNATLGGGTTGGVTGPA